MSALPLKADTLIVGINVRFGSLADTLTSPRRHASQSCRRFSPGAGKLPLLLQEESQHFA